jgi:hypothetical protein
MLMAALADTPTTAEKHEVWELTRDVVLCTYFGARPGFGDGTMLNEHRFRIDDHWPPKT